MMLEGLAGRESALELLRRASERAALGRGGLVLVAGEPGIGKTALVAAAMDRARHDSLTVLWATCWAGAGAPAYWPWIQVLRQYAQATDQQRLLTNLGADASEVARLVDEVAAFDEGPAAAADHDPDRARFRLFDGISSFLVRAAADQPLYVVLDDLQWADVSSLLLLRFLAARLPMSSLLLIGSFGDTEVGPEHPLHSLLGEVGSDSDLITLGGLAEVDVAHLIGEVSGEVASPELVEQVFRRTGGNPFFVREVTRLLVSRGGLIMMDGHRTAVPDGVRQVVEQRLARLSQPCVDLLSVAAVAGQEVSAVVLSRAASRSPTSVMELTDIAVRARVLSEPEAASGPYRFSHDLFRETLYDGMPAPERAVLHRQVGVALEELREQGAEVSAAELANHFLEAAVFSVEQTSPGDDRTVAAAVNYCVAAAETARARLAYEDAINHLQRGLDGLGSAGLLGTRARLELLLGLADARRATGDTGAAREDYELVADLARHSNDPSGLARATLGTVSLGLESGTSQEAAIAALEETLGALDDDQTDLRARVMATLARVVYHSFGGEDGRAEELSEAARGLARRDAADSTLAACLLARHDAIWVPGTALERRAVATEIGGLARRARDRELAAEASLLSAVAALELGDRRFLLEIDQFTALAAALRQPHWTYLALTRKVTRATLTGQFEEAEQFLAEADSLAQEIGEPDRANVAFNQLAELRVAQGREAELQPILANLVQPLLRELAAPHLAVLLQARGDRDGALAALAPSLAEPPSFARNTIFLLRWSWLSVAAASLGLPKLCEQCYAGLLPYAGVGAVTAGAVAFRGSVDHYLGLLAVALDRHDDAIGHFERAAGMHERLGAMPWLARTQTEWAAALQARGGRTDGPPAAQLIAAAGRTAQALGMPQVLERLDGLAVERLNGFSREGDVWTLSFDGAEVRLKDAKGLGDIALLLGAENREVPATTLLLGAATSGRPADRVRYGSDPMLDSTAREDYRQRLAELDEAIEEAELRMHPAGAVAAQAERDFLIRELAAAVGLGGRSRGLGDDAERARKAVTARIRDSLERISALHPALGRHLRESITTGLFCRYAPVQPTRWRL